MELTYADMLILSIWGCEDYEQTLERLTYLAGFTVDEDIKKRITRLHDCLIDNCSLSDYPEKYRKAISWYKATCSKRNRKEGWIWEIFMDM